jgi:beta-lactamase superfamily II metal-dependent hydrolase
LAKGYALKYNKSFEISTRLVFLPMKSPKILLPAILLLFSPLFALSFTPSGFLEIHTINVQQGLSVLIIGPGGTTILFDGGNNDKGSGEVVPYLQSIGISPEDGLDFMIASHLHSDHCGGLDEVIEAGYDVKRNIYDNGSDYWTPSVQDFKDAAGFTSSGGSSKMTIGSDISLGDCASLTCVVVDGEVLGFGIVKDARNNENDRSIGILIEHHNFQYLLAGDLGGGSSDSACTNRRTLQVDVETPLAQSLIHNSEALLGTTGVEVLHVNHHGSESSTNSDIMNHLTPQVALISVGNGQQSNWNHPRKAVVENVLQSQAGCITAESALVLQTEEGFPTGSKTSFAGFCVGDIIIKSDGRMTYSLEASGEVSQGSVEITMAGLPIVLHLEEYLTTENLPGSPYSLLYQNFPNPFTCTTTIQYQVLDKDYISLKIYDVAGRFITTLVSDVKEEGVYTAFWNGVNEEGLNVPCGIYVYRLQGTDFRDTRKLTYIPNRM